MFKNVSDQMMTYNNRIDLFKGTKAEHVTGWVATDKAADQRVVNVQTSRGISKEILLNLNNLAQTITPDHPSGVVIVDNADLGDKPSNPDYYNSESYDNLYDQLAALSNAPSEYDGLTQTPSTLLSICVNLWLTKGKFVPTSTVTLTELASAPEEASDITADKWYTLTSNPDSPCYFGEVVIAQGDNPL